MNACGQRGAAELKERTSGTNKWQGPVLILTGLLAFYLFMFLRYRLYKIDNPWSLSFTYSGLVQYVNGDQFMDHESPHGQGGIQFFGKLAAYPAVCPRSDLGMDAVVDGDFVCSGSSSGPWVVVAAAAQAWILKQVCIYLHGGCGPLEPVALGG